ncbi:MAG: TadE family protein [Chloroflexota bacterium]
MKRRKEQRGQSLVEFALIFPIFILLLVSIFDLGHVVWANDSLSNAAREAARFAVIHGASDRTTCPQGPLPTTYGGYVDSAAMCGFTPSSLIPLVDSREGIKAQATGWLSGIGGATTVSVCYGQVSSCSGDVDAPGAKSARGTKVTVTVTSSVGLAAPSLLGLGPFTLSATSTMLVNN